ncbi:MAG: hypothetical protein MUD16_07835 [Desulfobacterales bacterium]|jgi:hypothetical protein|nr:hypothetical protein [Desulfobacterales bacterium]
MKTNFSLALLVAFAIALAAGVASAQHTHGHGAGASGMKMDTREVRVEGLKVTFQIMANPEHRKMLKEMKMKDDIEAGTTHNVTVALTDLSTQAPITDAAVSMKVVDPKGADQVKSLKYEGAMKSYDAYFNLPAKGRYELLVLIRQGERRTTAGVYYDLK